MVDGSTFLAWQCPAWHSTVRYNPAVALAGQRPQAHPRLPRQGPRKAHRRQGLHLRRAAHLRPRQHREPLPQAALSPRLGRLRPRLDPGLRLLLCRPHQGRPARPRRRRRLLWLPPLSQAAPGASQQYSLLTQDVLCMADGSSFLAWQCPAWHSTVRYNPAVALAGQRPQAHPRLPRQGPRKAHRRQGLQLRRAAHLRPRQHREPLPQAALSPRLGRLRPRLDPGLRLLLCRPHQGRPALPRRRRRLLWLPPLSQAALGASSYSSQCVLHGRRQHFPCVAVSCKAQHSQVQPSRGTCRAAPASAPKAASPGPAQGAPAPGAAPPQSGPPAAAPAPGASPAGGPVPAPGPAGATSGPGAAPPAVPPSSGPASAPWPAAAPSLAPTPQPGSPRCVTTIFPVDPGCALHGRR